LNPSRPLATFKEPTARHISILENIRSKSVSIPRSPARSGTFLGLAGAFAISGKRPS
jgi:hypothetical protein